MDASKFIFVVVLCLYFQYSKAQEAVNEDSVETKKMQYSFSVMPALEWANVPEDYFTHARLEVGVSINDTYHIAAHGAKMMGKLTRRIVFPNVYEYGYYEYGGSLGYTVLNYNDLYIIGEMGIAYATAKWIDQSENQYVLKDKFWVFKPGVRVEFHFTKFLGIGGKINYRFAEEIELSAYDNDAFNGISSSIYLKIGLLK